MTDNDIVWRDNFNRDNDNKDDKLDRYVANAYETANEEYRKMLSRFLKIAAAVFLIFIIFFIVIIFKNQSLADKKQVLALEKRLDRLEDEFTSLKVYIASKLDQAIKEMERDRRTATPQNKPLAETQPLLQEEPISKDVKVHKVQAGDSLYRISVQYGISMALLRDYNNLEPDATIHPGQEIKLTP